MRTTFFILALFVIGCGGQQESGKEQADDKFVTIAEDDAEMDAAIEQARKTYPAFIEQLKAEDTATTDFSAKIPFESAENVEYIWCNDLYFAGDRLYGTVGLDPRYFMGLKTGDTVEIEKKNLFDWMYVRDGKLVGGYTTKVIFRRMTKQEQQAFTEEMGYIIE